MFWLAVMCVGLLGAAHSPQDVDVEKTVKELASENAESRQQAVAKLSKMRQTVIKETIKLLNTLAPEGKSWEFARNRDSVRAAIDLLGEYRASEASTVLVRLCRYPPGGGDWTTEELRTGVSPATKALSKIGKPAVPAILKGKELGLGLTRKRVISEQDRDGR